MTNTHLVFALDCCDQQNRSHTMESNIDFFSLSVSSVWLEGESWGSHQLQEQELQDLILGRMTWSQFWLQV